MRWPFHFGGSARKGVAEPAARSDRRDWATLPPIQRTIGETELTARSLQFSRALPGSEEPALSVEALGHHRSTEGPQGLVIGIANPIETYAPTTELIGRPRRRGEAAVGVLTSSEGLAGSTSTDPGRAVTMDEDSAPDLLTRVLPAVVVEAPNAPPPVGRLTDASKVELGPLRPVQRSPETAAPAPPPPAPPAATRLSLGLSRRHGLGAPIRGADALQRSTIPYSPPVASPPPEAHPAPAQAPVAEEQQTSAAVPISPAQDEVRSQTPALEAALSPLPPLRRQSGAGRTEVSDAGQDDAFAVRGLQERELQATRFAPAPSGALVALQRLAGSDSSSPGKPDSRNTPVPYKTTPTVPLTSGRPSLTTVRLPGEPERVHLPGNQSPQAFGAFREMPQPAGQTSPGLSWNPAGAPGGPPVPRAFRTPDSSPLVWNVQRMGAAEAPGEEPMTADGPPPAAAESPSAGTPAMAAAPAMVPTVAAGPVPGAEGAPRPGDATAAGAGAPGAGAAPTAHGEKELDDLAHLLFPKLMSLLRLDLLVERERAGWVTDLR